MANIIGDIGRSDAFKVSQSLLGDVMQVGQQERQGLLGTLQAQEAQNRTAIMQAEEARRMQESALKVKALEDEQKWRKSPMSIKSSPLLPSPDDETYQEKFNKLREMSGANEVGITTNEGMLKAAQMMKSTPEAMKEWYKPRLDKLENEINSTDEKIFKAEVAGDPAKTKELKAQRERLVNMHLQKSGQYDKWLMEGKKQEDDVERAKIAQQRADEAERYHRAQQASETRKLDIMQQRADQIDLTRGAESKEVSRKARVLKETRQEVAAAYGMSSFMEQAKEPLIYEKAMKTKSLAEDIVTNYDSYGLAKEPTPAKAAELAKNKVEESYKIPIAPAADKKEKSILESLFGTKK